MAKKAKKAKKSKKATERGSVKAGRGKMIPSKGKKC